MSIFTKHNHSNFKDSLIKEVRGLELLRREIGANNIPYLKIPEVYSVDDHELQIESIDTVKPKAEQMRQFGEGLALLHRIKQKHFGFEQNNYIGLSIQPNKLSENWGEFFVQYRLGFQVSLIKDQSIKIQFERFLEQSLDKLVGFLNENFNHPSLVHGDLWSGNVLFDQSNIWLIDPAVHYADREVDVAMTEMFGGFSQDFYQAYDQIYPLSPDYQQKKIIYNLYHYLNHYNLFGAGYLSACIRGFKSLKSI